MIKIWSHYEHNVVYVKDLKILTDEKVKDFGVINFGEYFKSTRERLYSKLAQEENLRKVAELFYTSWTTPDEEEKYV